MKIFISLSIIAVFLLSSCKQSSSENHKKIKNKTTEPVLLSNRNRKASSVYLTQDKNNTPLISWGEIDTVKNKKHFYFSQIDTISGEFKRRQSIPIEQNASIHAEGMPKIAVKGDGSLFALYETSEPLKDSKWGLGDTRYVQSFDNGKTWTSSKSVAPKDYDNNLSSSFSGLTRLSDGKIGVAWLSTNKDKTKEGRPVKFAKTMGKDSLSDPILIDDKACECCRISLNSNKNNNLIIAYRDLLPREVRDISVALSKNNGDTFSKPVAFSGDHWKIKGCPHNGPAVVSTKNHFFVTWFTNKKGRSGVNYAVLDGQGKMKHRRRITVNGHFIQIDRLPNGDRILAYSEAYQKEGDYYSKIKVERIKDHKIFEKEITPAKATADYPVIQAVDNHKLIVAWHEKEQVFYRIIPIKAINIPINQTDNWLPQT